jgi:hypothetical protein
MRTWNINNWRANKNWGREMRKPFSGRFFVCGGTLWAVPALGLRRIQQVPWRDGRTARPKCALGLARQFSLTFERRELRLTPTSACSQVSFMERRGRSFRGAYNSLHSRPRVAGMTPEPTSPWAHVGRHGPRNVALKGQNEKHFWEVRREKEDDPLSYGSKE